MYSLYLALYLPMLSVIHITWIVLSRKEILMNCYYTYDHELRGLRKWMLHYYLWMCYKLIVHSVVGFARTFPHMCIIYFDHILSSPIYALCFLMSSDNHPLHSLVLPLSCYMYIHYFMYLSINEKRLGIFVFSLPKWIPIIWLCLVTSTLMKICNFILLYGWIISKTFIHSSVGKHPGSLSNSEIMTVAAVDITVEIMLWYIKAFG